jgi:hypothetical protein
MLCDSPGCDLSWLLLFAYPATRGDSKSCSLSRYELSDRIT